ncbi:MAG: hypothetical protein L6437_04380 [Kiritimatiellae bacterium]|nr:hypothetical protein [Kiritimatiellia bacterium]
MNNGKSFFVLAQQLATQQTDKAALRSAVSRAYYGAFNYGRHLLRRLGFKHIADGGDHGIVWRFFQNCGERDIAIAGQNLANLQSDRVKADYKLNNPIFDNPNNVQLRILSAKSIIAEFDNCIASSQKTNAVIQGMKNYEQLTVCHPST